MCSAAVSRGQQGLGISHSDNSQEAEMPRAEAKRVLNFRLADRGKSQGQQSKRQKRKAEGHTAAVPQSLSTRGQLGATPTACQPEQWEAREHVSLQRRICHWLSIYHKQKPLLAKHVAGKKNVNLMDRATQKNLKRGRRTTNSTLRMTDRGEPSSLRKVQQHLW